MTLELTPNEAEELVSLLRLARERLLEGVRITDGDTQAFLQQRVNGTADFIRKIGAEL